MKLPFKILSLSIVVILFTTEINAQGIDFSEQRNIYPFLYNNTVDELSHTGDEKQQTFEKAVAEASGSSYYDEEFRKATISGSDYIFNVRYNAFLDEMEITHENEIVYLNKKYDNRLITLAETNMTYKVLREQDENKKITSGYFIALQTNESVALYRKDRKKYVRSTRPLSKEKAKFQNARRYFYVEINNSGMAIKLPNNKKELAALFPDKEAEILTFIKQERLKLRKEEDLKMLVTYINSI
ncbi:hypothetical protein U8527_02375 [Kordia algicida OT-1]|uniref:Uncharacterized protein n=1 Tax=Kordia algicida OT-1 TaxID=391587 RepID=A9DNC1_9FLAO|nr:hypothetical protein [Kordia algicida]EDP97156.1 hypothetical protein KAOT1_18377 [Kordia algicida OT-1]